MADPPPPGNGSRNGQPSKPEPSQENGEFGQFEELTRKLFQVPKRELDQKRKQVKR